jgi:cell division protein FtsQ
MTRKRKQAKRRSSAPPAPRRWPRQITGVVLLGALTGLCGWGYVKLSDPHTLPVRSVRIDGRFQHLARAELERAVAPYATGGFFTVEVGAVQQAAEALPWVDRVSVRRVWPDALYITVVEHVPLARWGKDGVLTDRGEVFQPKRDTIPTGLPEVVGPEGQQALVADWYRDMNQALTAVDLSVARLVLNERRALRLTLNNGLELSLGRGEAYRRLLRFVQVYPRVLAPKVGRIQGVDMRYTNGFAVSWNTTAADPERG